MSDHHNRSTLTPESVSQSPEASSFVWGMIGWCLLALVIGVLALYAQVQSIGGQTAQILAAGSGPLAEYTSDQLPGTSWDPTFIHDGHRFFAVASDLAGKEVPGLIEDPSYRYARILYPAIASGFGLFNGTALLWGMLITSLGAYIWSVAATFAIGNMLDLPWLTPMVTLSNVGLLLGLMLVTADPLAIALYLTGVAFALRYQHLRSALFLGLAGLAKEAFLVGAIGIAAWHVIQRRPRAALPYFLSVIPTVVWMTILRLRYGGGLDDSDNLGLPLGGILESAEIWSQTGLRDRAFVAVAAASIVAGLLVLAVRRRLWAWLTLPWVVVGLVASHWVWDFGNNAVRVLAPLLTIVALAFLDNRRLKAVQS